MDGLDPFVQHFEREMGEKLRQSLKEDKPVLQKHNFDWPVLERVSFVGLAKCEDEDIISDTSTTINISELDKLPPAKVPEPPLIPLKNTSLISLHIKSQLHDTIPIANQVSYKILLMVWSLYISMHFNKDIYLLIKVEYTIGLTL